MLFAPTKTAVHNLEKEGFDLDQQAPYTADRPKVYHCGDVMYDNSMHFAELAGTQVDIVNKMKLSRYALVTIHRPYNTDDPARLKHVMLSLLALAEEQELTLVFPIHPRTRKLLRNEHSELFARVQGSEAFHLIEPVSFLEMIQLEQHASLVITDSGGVQKEAFFFRKPCLVVRTETEWVELIETGAARLQFEMGASFVAAAKQLLQDPPTEFPAIFGSGKAAEFICEQILTQL
jgi:UDP-GlcNAc3NAcA epimerase